MSTKNVVLYADDDTDDLQFIKEAFSPFSTKIELVTVADGLEAIQYLEGVSSENSTPCLIILDINMPRLDGKETLKKIRELHRFKDIPVILFTTSSQKTDEEFAKKYNAGFITKPVDYLELDAIANLFINHCSEETMNSTLINKYKNS